MKKGVCLIIFLVSLLVIIIIATISVAGEITGDTITGEASAQHVGISISIAAPPALLIISPENETYLTNESLLLNYSVSGQDFVWYNLDNIAPNKTITSSVFFNTSQGSHILYLYANNSNGVRKKTISFTANSTRFTIIDDEYETGTGGNTKRKKKKGSSTDFFNYSYEELQELENIILHIPNFGKILFNQAVNLTDDEDPADNVLDLDSHTNISSNRIKINSTALPNFNKIATLWLYNLTFSTPRILKDGVVCLSSVCTQESYTGGALKTLKFNVTGFTVYSAEETPSNGGVTPTGSGGSVTTKKDFTVDQTIIKVMLKQGESFKETLKIKNTGNTIQTFELIVSESLKDMIFSSEYSFDIGPNQEKIVDLNFVSKNIEPSVYTGNLKIKTESKTKEILIIYSIKSKVVLFDMSLDIPAKYKELSPGQELLLQLTLFNLGGTGKEDVSIEYIIKDFEGNIIIEQSAIIAVETQASFSKTIKLPSDIKPGDYVAIAQARYDASLGSSSAMFHVVEEELEISKLVKNRYFIIVLFILALLVIFIIILKYERKKMKKEIKVQKRKTKITYQKPKRKISRRKTLPRIAFRIRDKFGRQLEALEQAYASRYIGKKSYLKGKEKIRKANK